MEFFLNTMFLFSALLLLISTYEISNVDATNNQVDKMETSTNFRQIFEHTSANHLVENNTALIHNVSNVSVVTTTITNIPNSTALNVPVAGKNVNATLYHYNYTTTYSSSSNSDGGLSGGAIAGIVIGVIVLLCCCGVLGFCKKSGHWETRDVWVKD